MSDVLLSTPRLPSPQSGHPDALDAGGQDGGAFDMLAGAGADTTAASMPADDAEAVGHREPTPPGNEQQQNEEQQQQSQVAPDGARAPESPPATPASGSSSAPPSGEMVIREHLVQSAVQFLCAKAVREKGEAAARAFLQQKGLSAAEIALAVRRSRRMATSSSSWSSAPVVSASGTVPPHPQTPPATAFSTRSSSAQAPSMMGSAQQSSFSSSSSSSASAPYYSAGPPAPVQVPILAQKPSLFESTVVPAVLTSGILGSAYGLFRIAKQYWDAHHHQTDQDSTVSTEDAAVVSRAELDEQRRLQMTQHRQQSTALAELTIELRALRRSLADSDQRSRLATEQIQRQLALIQQQQSALLQHSSSAASCTSSPSATPDAPTPASSTSSSSSLSSATATLSPNSSSSSSSSHSPTTTVPVVYRPTDSQLTVQSSVAPATIASSGSDSSLLSAQSESTPSASASALLPAYRSSAHSASASAAGASHSALNPSASSWPASFDAPAAAAPVIQRNTNNTPPPYSSQFQEVMRKMQQGQIPSDVRTDIEDSPSESALASALPQPAPTRPEKPWMKRREQRLQAARSVSVIPTTPTSSSIPSTSTDSSVKLPPVSTTATAMSVPTKKEPPEEDNLSSTPSTVNTTATNAKNSAQNADVLSHDSKNENENENENKNSKNSDPLPVSSLVAELPATGVAPPLARQDSIPVDPWLSE